jgi:hypothetical protein
MTVAKKKKSCKGFPYCVNIIGCTALQHLSVSVQESGRLHSLAHGYTTLFTVLTGTLRSHVGFSTTVMPSKPVPVRSPGASQLPILLISASESSKFMDDFNSTFYQGFLWVIAISHLQLPQRLDTLRLYRGSCDELHTPEAKQRLVQMILIYTKLSGHNRWWRQGK